jgi:hypothetical protein
VIQLKLTDVQATPLEDASLGNNYIYKDLELDLNKTRTFTKAVNVTNYLSDVSSIFDLKAISESSAFFIREDIFDNLPIFEPRVVVKNVSVIPNIDEQLYEIYLQIDVPQLNIYGVSIKNILNSEGYI